ncbi:mannitol operon transcriptional antiterminator [Evansella caseinilytica]|uniref:Mannitol operon transcriptional antiterminator n=1 Tax=Evansella caseinilytica TaxID=1503961 RepID=A0A1H3QC04_9BACI|nr:BglG family transcription antiterminator [Evansella caseinilytica]SDZ10239.1 mannitol operon transcriptional antiterminator [Evansella caseinilytica]
MYVSARERQILEYLIKNAEGVTIQEIASSLGVSERTIHRDLSTIDSLLSPYHVLILKKTGLGIMLKGERQDIEALREALQQAKHQDFTPNERVILIISKLLESFEPIKLQAFAVDLNVTAATISSDLERVAEWLSRYRLKLVRRRGYGIDIEGSEADKRRAISSILTENFSESELLKYIRLNFSHPKQELGKAISDHLLGFIEINKLRKVEKAVDQINKELPHPIADSAYLGLVVHLALALERILKGEKITINPQMWRQLQEEKEYTFARKLARQLEKSFHVSIPDAEIGYITMHLRGAKLRHDSQVQIEDKNFEIAMTAKKLIASVSEKLGINLKSDDSLYQGLIAHLEPALYRLKQNMAIHNPLLKKVKENYSDLFEVIQASIAQVLPGVVVPEAEIGFLVLHFGSSMEREGKARSFKAFVLCSSGIGSSKMLSSRLQKEFPNITDVKNISLLELDEAEQDGTELIISTIPLNKNHIDYVQVTPFLTEEDVQKVTSYIRHHLRRTLTNLQTQEKMPAAKTLPLRKKNETISFLNSLDNHVQTAAFLLENYQLYQYTGASGIWAAVASILEDLAEKQLITDAKEVLRRLKERESLSGIGIPNTAMALFHTRSAAIVKPVFMMGEIPEPVEMRAMDNKTTKVKSILLLLAPDQAAEETLNVLSYISSLIIESDESMRLFQTNEEAVISDYLSQKLFQYIRNQLEKRS